jgi:thymidylate synthase
MHTITMASANELWRAARGHIFSPGADVTLQPSRAGDTRELLHVAMELSAPRDRWIVSRRPALNPAFAIAEVVWILAGRDDAGFLNRWNRRLPEYAGFTSTYPGAYGHRLRKHFGFDQFRRAYDALRANPDSRQVVLQFWDGARDFPDHDGLPRTADIPCNALSLLKVRHGALHWTQIMRSTDLYRGLPYNLIQFTVLQEVLAGWLGLELGSYHHWSDSLHAYSSDIDTFSADDRVASHNSDSLALPVTDADGLIGAMYERIWSMSAEGVELSGLDSLASVPDLPVGWQNMMWLVAAEAARRQSDEGVSAALSSRCTNPALLQVWGCWLASVATRRAGASGARS